MSVNKRTEDGFGVPKDKLEFASVEALKTLIAGASDKDGAVHALTLFNLVAATTITAIESIAAGTRIHLLISG